MSAVQKHLKTAAIGLIQSRTSGFSPSASPDIDVMLKNEMGGVDHTQKLEF